MTQRDKNQAAFRRLEPAIGRDYAKGRFVAIADARIVADAATIEELDSLLSAQGVSPRDVLVVEAGAEYPERVTIFL